MASPLAGADGCKGGWILVQTARPGAPVTHVLCPDAATLLARTPRDAVLGIDIPIGISDRDRRAAEVECKRTLGARRSSVFWSPVRAALDATTHEDANARNREASGLGLSAQAFHITRRIAEVDALLRADAGAATRVHEVHPEACFAALNGGAPMRHPKKRAEGHAERRALLAAIFPGAFETIREAYRVKEVASDDILDALAALWTASRIAAGTARTFPAGAAPRDRYGLPMVIHA
jgi:predicted RNase H-like nuclease